jgi:hypothetical protein
VPSTNTLSLLQTLPRREESVKARLFELVEGCLSLMIEVLLPG